MTSTLSSATSPATPTASRNAAPVPQYGSSMSQRNLVIILAAIIAALVAAAVGFVVVRCTKRSSRRVLFHRAATPLPETEFDLWRRSDRSAPSYRSGGTTVYKSTGIRYDAKGDVPAPVCSIIRVDPKVFDHSPRRPVTPPQQDLLGSSPIPYSPAMSTKPLIRSTSMATTVSHHKSSMSLQDRPPTPYSPSSPPSAWDEEALFTDVPQSPRQKEHRVHIHYPSVSEVSDFDFGYALPDSPRQNSGRRESWVHHSRRLSSFGQQYQAFPSYHLSELDELIRKTGP